MYVRLIVTVYEPSDGPDADSRIFRACQKGCRIAGETEDRNGAVVGVPGSVQNSGGNLLQINII